MLVGTTQSNLESKQTNRETKVLTNDDRPSLRNPMKIVRNSRIFSASKHISPFIEGENKKQKKTPSTK